MTTTLSTATRGRLAVSFGWIRPFILMGSVTLTFLFSLVHRLRLASSQTPIAYFAIVPVLALVIGIWQYRVMQPTVVARTAVDMIVGSACLVLAMGITFGGPVIFNAYTAWAHPDLLALPLYATGIFCLLYGLSGFQWGWSALAMLFLIWPTPLQVTLPGVLDALVNFTAATLRAIVAFVPVRTHPDGLDSTLFVIATPQGDGILGIGSACAGFEAISTVGLLSGAMLLVSKSKAAARWQQVAGKLAWFACGIALATIGNIIRIAVVFGAAHAFGITFAMTVVHPYVGMIALVLNLILLLVLRPRFGLSLTMPRTPRPLPWADLRWGFGMSFVTMLVLAGLVR